MLHTRGMIASINGLAFATRADQSHGHLDSKKSIYVKRASCQCERRCALSGMNERPDIYNRRDPQHRRGACRGFHSGGRRSRRSESFLDFAIVSQSSIKLTQPKLALRATTGVVWRRTKKPPWLSPGRLGPSKSRIGFTVPSGPLRHRCRRRRRLCRPGLGCCPSRWPGSRAAG